MLHGFGKGKDGIGVFLHFIVPHEDFHLTAEGKSFAPAIFTQVVAQTGYGIRSIEDVYHPIPVAIYGEEEERKCRIQRTRDLEHTYKNPAGGMDQVVARAKMFCTGDPIPERSVVTVDGLEYIVLECYRAFGFGEDHLEVTLQ